MTKSSYCIGLAIAILAHALLFLALPRGEEVPREAEEEKPPPLIRVAMKEKERPEADSHELQVNRREPDSQLLDQQSLTDHVQSDPNDAAEPSLGETASEETIDSDDTLPNMQIIWSSPAECRTVAEALGMKIVGVTPDQRIAGELRLSGEMELVPFDGDLSCFSNRVRSLPVSFFGRIATKDSKTIIAAYWILVPTDVDMLFSGQIRRKLCSLGHDASEVRLVKARVNVDPYGKYFLEVTQVDLFS